MVDLRHDLKADVTDSRLFSIFLEHGFGFIGFEARRGNLGGEVLVVECDQILKMKERVYGCRFGRWFGFNGYCGCFLCFVVVRIGGMIYTS